VVACGSPGNNHFEVSGEAGKEVKTYWTTGDIKALAGPVGVKLDCAGKGIRGHKGGSQETIQRDDTDQREGS